MRLLSSVGPLPPLLCSPLKAMRDRSLHLSKRRLLIFLQEPGYFKPSRATSHRQQKTCNKTHARGVLEQNSCGARALDPILDKTQTRGGRSDSSGVPNHNKTNNHFLLCRATQQGTGHCDAVRRTRVKQGLSRPKHQLLLFTRAHRSIPLFSRHSPPII